MNWRRQLKIAGFTALAAVLGVAILAGLNMRRNNSAAIPAINSEVNQADRNQKPDLDLYSAIKAGDPSATNTITDASRELPLAPDLPVINNTIGTFTLKATETPASLKYAWDKVSTVSTSTTATSSAEEIVLLDVPFTSQAPFAEWSDPRQQDGCEEAASLMAVKWARGEGLTREEAKREILAIAAYEEKNFGSYIDTSATATAERIIKGYFSYENVSVKFNVKADDIIAELGKGNVVLAPMDGQALDNPNFTPPGPERHMLLIRGYDPNTDEFITNDNGTRRGEGYRYNRDVLYSAIRDYPTGDKLPIESVRKNVIIVHK